MSNNVPDINSMTEEERKQLYEYECSKFIKICKAFKLENVTDKDRYLQEECCATLTVVLSLLAVFEKDPNIETNSKADDFKNLTYQSLRRIFEGFFNIMYIFDDTVSNDESNKRFFCYLNSVKKEYNKLITNLLNNGYPTLGMNTTPATVDPSLNWMNVADRMSHIHAGSYDLGYLYAAYRIFTFYAHGNANRSIIEAVTGTNNFSKIQILPLIGMITNFYNCLICQKWPHIANKLGYQVV